MSRFLSFFVWFALIGTSFGQIEAPKEVNPYTPIIVSYAIPAKGDTEVQVSWRVSSDTVQYETVPNTNTLHVWAPPGDHWIEATVASQSYREQLVLVPDPAAPTDLTKAKAEKVRIATGFSINRYVANFKVKGSLPTPVNPNVPVTPIVTVPSAELQTIMAPVKDVMVKADPAKAAIWLQAWVDFFDSVKANEPFKNAIEFKTATGSFLNAVTARHGLTNAFPGFTAAMDKAFADYFGEDGGKYSPSKVVEFIAATLWAVSSK